MIHIIFVGEREVFVGDCIADRLSWKQALLNVSEIEIGVEIDM